MRPLRVLVYPHAMELGGSQLNAIELAGAVRDLGHDVVILGEDGPLVDVVDRLGLARLPLVSERRRPSPSVTRMLRELIATRRLDIVHGYEWPPGLEAAAAVFPGRQAAAVCTVMSMAVAPFLPDRLPLVVGTEALRQRSAARRTGSVHLIEPPVDVEQNRPGPADPAFLSAYGLTGDALTVGVVGRLVPELKLEGVLTAIDAVGDLARDHAVQLVIVGDGTARDTVATRAEAANARAGRRAVVLTGELADPRPAYATADIMLGMGGSALRALAFAKPLVVQGERGFWSLLTPQTCPLFLEQGWYGVGSPADATPQVAQERLSTILGGLIADPTERARLGQFGRTLAVERFSLRRAGGLQEEIYRSALAHRRDAGTLRQAVQGTRSASGVVLHKVKRRYAGLRGTRVRDDFNAVTLAAPAASPHSEV